MILSLSKRLTAFLFATYVSAIALSSQPVFSEENVSVVQVAPSWNIFNNYSSGESKLRSYSIYNTYFQRQVLEILASMNIHAVPSLYTSAFQTIYDPRSLDELNELLKYEPKEQRKYLTLIPVIINSSIEAKRKRYQIVLSLAIYLLETGGQLGKKLLAAELKFKGRFKSIPATEEDFESQLNTIKEKLSGQKEWQTIKQYINQQGKEYQPFPKFNTSTFFKEQTTHYFAQSEGLYFNDRPERAGQTPVRFHKSNVLIITANESTDKLLFDFDLADEIPSVEYAYSITPDFKVIQVQNGDIHVEKSPDALPSDTYNSKRYLVINLPGITSGTVVCYAVKYLDRGYYDTAYFDQLKLTRYRCPLARDFPVNFSADSTPWQLRILMPANSENTELHAQSNNLFITDSISVRLYPYDQHASSYPVLNQSGQGRPSSYSLMDKELRNKIDRLMRTVPVNGFSEKRYIFKMFLFQGLPTPMSIPVMEPLTYVEPPIIRVSSVLGWNRLYSETRDSIFAILNRRSKRNHILPTRSKPNESVYESVFSLQNYMADSLRYIHLSFNAHKTIPVSPDSILKSKMGDCKDYSTLFISELNSIGLEAYPALVNTTWPNSLVMTLPSYDAFNHMIVYVPEYKWWVDPLYFPIPPWLIPGYVTGLRSLVLFKDSMRIMAIQDNVDSTSYSSIKYEIEISGQNIKCSYREVSSIEKSFYVRKYLSKIDSTRHLDFLFPSEKYVKRYSTKELGLHIGGLESKDNRLSITRQFEVNNALISAGGSKLLNLPEMPLFWYVSIVSANNRLSDLYLPSDLICDVAIKLIGGYKVKWPNLVKAGEYSTILKVAKTSNNEIVFRFTVKKGLMSLKEYAIFKSALDSYRNFFSNPIPVQKNAK